MRSIPRGGLYAPSDLAVAVLVLSACGGIQPNRASPTTGSAPSAVAARVIQLVADPGQLPIGGGEATIRVEVIGVNGQGVAQAAVALEASGGSLEFPRAVTDDMGHAKVLWSGTQSETITATFGGLSTTMTIPVEVPPVALPPGTPPLPPPAPAPPPPPAPAPPQIPTLVVFLSASPDQALTGQSVTFSANARGLSNENVSSYQWDFDGDGTADETSSGSSVAHIYTTHGVKPATVTIRTTAGRSAVGTRSVTVGTGPLVLGATLAAAPLSVVLGESVTFTATPQSLGSDTVKGCDWQIEGFVSAAVIGGSPCEIDYVIPTDGAKFARVTIHTFNGRSASATTSVLVTPTPPLPFAVVLAASAGPYTTAASVTFTATLSTADPGGLPSSLTYAWNFNNDGAVDEITTSATSNPRTFSVVGDHTVKVTVTAPDGRMATNTATITVT